jgi:hypothetical protein
MRFLIFNYRSKSENVRFELVLKDDFLIWYINHCFLPRVAK